MKLTILKSKLLSALQDIVSVIPQQNYFADFIAHSHRSG